MAARCFEAPTADAIVVLGCRGSAALTRRLEHGIRLFREGAAPLLVLSGGGAGPVPEAQRMRRAALACGVPEAALLIDPRSRNTIENAREAARLLRSQGLRSVLLVSDRAHLPRAAVLFRLAGLQVAGRVGVPALSMTRAAGAAIREAVALPWSLLRVVLRRRLRGEPGEHAPERYRDGQGRTAGEQEKPGGADPNRYQGHRCN